MSQTYCSTRTKCSNRKMAASTEAYREIAIAKSNKRRKKKSSREDQIVIGTLQAGMQAAVKRRMELEAAAQSVAEARESINDSDDDTPTQNEFHDIPDEICAETGYESDESEDELHKAWKLYQAIIHWHQSASRKSQLISKTDATCTISHEGGPSMAPSQNYSALTLRALKMSKIKNLKRSNFGQSVFFRAQNALCGKTGGAIIGLWVSKQDGMVFSSSPTCLSFVRVNPPIPTHF
jgi:hypothetical protein